MRRLIRYLTALIAVITATTVFGDTVVPGGTVSGTWATAGSAYLIEGDIIINNGSTLTIEPGVDVNFQGHYMLTVNGELHAVGTETDSIGFFAADTTIGWKGISFLSTGFGRIEFAAVQYVRSDIWGVSAVFIGSAGHVDLANCTINNNNGYDGGGIFLDPAWGANFTISHCSISHNEASDKGGGIYGGGTGTIEYCVISKNYCFGAAVSGGGAYISSPVDTVIFDHCTFSRNDGYGADGIYHEYNNFITLRNCIFEGHAGCAILTTTDSIVTYSAFYNNLEDLYTINPTGFGDLVQVNANGDSCDIYGNIFLDPLFCDTVNEDLQIAENSFCLGAGEGGSDIGALGIGCTLVDVLEQQQPLPNEFSLSQNYPNPFNPKTVIEINLPRRSVVKISVFNLLGQEVTELVDQEYPAGSHRITWDGSTNGGLRASTGVYFYRVEAEGHTATKKMLLLK